MNKFTLIIICAAIVAPCASATVHKNAPALFKHAQIERPRATIGKKPLRLRGNQAIMKPTIQKVYGWDGGEWLLNETYETEYTTTGLISVDNITDWEGKVLRQTYEYDENGMMTSKLTVVSEDGETFENSERIERQYDERLTSIITENKEWMWIDNEWSFAGNCYQRIITRNADGNITSCVIATLFMGEYDPSQRIDITYGEDGKASRIEEQQLIYNKDYQFVWVTTTICKDIVWDRTDGQITATDNLFMGANRIASAVFVDGDGVEKSISATYFPDSEKYELYFSITSADGDIKGTQSFTPTENGGYKVVSRTDYMELEKIVGTEIITETASFDEYDNLLLYEAILSDGDAFTEVIDRTEGTVEYDSTKGYPLSYTVSEYDVETEDMVNYIRVEFSDYTDVSAGIDVIEANSHLAPVEYYNLQGIRVDTPTAGNVYIRRQGAKATKVLMR